MIFDIITIFPEIFNSFLGESLIARAQKKRLIKIKIHNLRKWSYNKHKSIDDKPFGGGLGMVFKIEPIYRAVNEIKKKKKTKVVLFTPRGKKFNQKIAYQLSKLDQIIMICGRYEGVDERAAKYIADIELSIGDYDLMGGDLPAMVIMETVCRLIPGVLGKPQLLKERITKTKGFIEYPQYTRPEIFNPNRCIKKRKACPSKFRKAKIWRVPKVLISGNHKKIEEWRTKHQKTIGK
ncbi:MAG: tRNA (guanosine(37)-N1)-methyltransferase TrmD [Candidatus Nealsonbacteria bacterium]|nr:tRNA (guanosine(37)-N1)-methyltransferase TrmD [Candidatus Nealsonbacteria bacterium]